MEKMMWQQARKVTQLYQTADKMARFLEAHTAFEETQWRGMRKWMEDRERKWDAHHKGDVLWGMGSFDMAMKILARTIAGEKEPEAENGLQLSN